MKRFIWVSVSALIVLVMLLGACADRTTPVSPTTPVTTPGATTTPVASPTTTVPTTAPTTPPVTTVKEPQYGGNLTVLGLHPTTNPLSWDPADWAWKNSQDTGYYLEHLFMGDLSKGPRGTNEYAFTGDAYIPEEFATGQLAVSWEIKQDPQRIVIQLRQGVYWQDKPGVMTRREFVAADAAFALNRLKDSPKAIAGYFGGEIEIVAESKYTLVVYMPTFFANWMYALGTGYYDAIYPKEMADAGATDWKNACGTGPYMITDFVSGARQVYDKNPNYWGTTEISGTEYKLPFTDRITKVIITDESTRLAAIRTGRVDMALNAPYTFAQSLLTPGSSINYNKWLHTGGIMVALRMDTPPFDDIRVRQAFNLAVNQQAILDAIYHGDGMVCNYPFAAFWPEYTPLDQLPAESKMLYDYDPAKARELLKAAGVPANFKVKFLAQALPVPADTAAMIVAYLADVGVQAELETLEYASFLSAMTTKTHPPMYLFGSGHTNPIACLRKNFLTGQPWNPYMFDDAWFNATYAAALANPNTAERSAVFSELNLYAKGKAPAIWLPSPYNYTFWWPWVNNYYGELRVQADTFGPILARVWLDRKMKADMGY